MNVLVLRPEMAGQETARKLQEAGHNTVCLPLAALRQTDVRLPERDFDAVLLTSAAAPRMLLARSDGGPFLARIARLPVYCAGEATSGAAQAAGFENPIDCKSGAAAIARRLRADQLAGRLEARPDLLYLAARQRAFDFADKLTDAHIHLVEIYDAELLIPPGDEISRSLDECHGGAILFHSARICAHLFAVAHEYKLEDKLKGMKMVAISDRVADAAPDWAGHYIRVAKSPNEAEMLRELRLLAKSHRH